MTERPEELLTNPRSDRVRMVRRLAGRSARLRHGQFLVEGPQSVRELVGHAPQRVRDLYLTPAAAQRYPEITAAARASVAHVHRASPEVVAAMSADCQGVLAVARIEPGSPDRLDGAGLLAVLAPGTDPGNVGTIIRAADAAGAGGVLLGPGSVEPTNPKVVRASAGSLFHLPVVEADDFGAALDRLRGRGVQLLAADASGRWDLDALADAAAADGAGVSPDRPDGSDGDPAQPAPDLRRPTAWIFGHEAHGLDDQVRELADAVVRVPIHGLAESLNVATAATVCLYASARAQRRS